MTVTPRKSVFCESHSATGLSVRWMLTPPGAHSCRMSSDSFWDAMDRHRVARRYESVVHLQVTLGCPKRGHGPKRWIAVTQQA
jgi:hypothetical protein